jgi:hypothetical protein
MTEYVKETAIVGLVVLEALALYLGYDGIVFSACIALIAGLAGYTIAEMRKV